MSFKRRLNSKLDVILEAVPGLPKDTDPLVSHPAREEFDEFAKAEDEARELEEMPEDLEDVSEETPGDFDIDQELDKIMGEGPLQADVDVEAGLDADAEAPLESELIPEEEDGWDIIKSDKHEVKMRKKDTDFFINAKKLRTTTDKWAIQLLKRGDDGLEVVDYGMVTTDMANPSQYFGWLADDMLE